MHKLKNFYEKNIYLVHEGEDKFRLRFDNCYYVGYEYDGDMKTIISITPEGGPTIRVGENNVTKIVSTPVGDMDDDLNDMPRMVQQSGDVFIYIEKEKILDCDFLLDK